MAGEVKLDALPYFDQEYDQPGARETVNYLYCIGRHATSAEHVAEIVPF